VRKALQDAAQVAGIDFERGGQVAGRRVRAAGQLEEHARLGQRVGRAQKVIGQDTDALRVEAVELPEQVDPTVERSGHAGGLLDDRQIPVVRTRAPYCKGASKAGKIAE
jgi:hypothetical protein